MNPSEPGTSTESARLRHYVLFGAPTDPATQAHLLLAQDFLLAARAVFGFSPDEAALAQRVTIIGDTFAVDATVERRLVAAGARVERVEGAADELVRALARLSSGGQAS